MDDILTELQYYQYQNIGGCIITNPNLRREIQNYFKLKGIIIENYNYIDIYLNSPYETKVKLCIKLSFRTGNRYFSLESKSQKIKTAKALLEYMKFGRNYQMNMLNVVHLLFTYFKDINNKKENRFALATYGSMMTENTEKWKAGYISQDLIRYVMEFY